MRFCGILLASGSSQRFGADKLWQALDGRPVWLASLQSVAAAAGRWVVVMREEKAAEAARIAPPWCSVVTGGATRTESLRQGVRAVPAGFDAVLVHDGARPFCPPGLAERVAAAAAAHGAAYPAVPVADTVRLVHEGGSETLDRSRLVAAQTPQGVRLDWLQEALDLGVEATDEAALVELAGHRAVPVEGDPRNRKLTFVSDMPSPAECRTGIGYDVHRFSGDPGRTLMLGGVAFPGEPALEGHSDADAVLHAATDAILGAAGLGDIGEHFPDSDPQWAGANSGRFLRHAASLARAAGWNIINLDVTVIAERPRISHRRDAMRESIAACLEIEVGRVGLKATTNEGLGAIGRGEGIASFAVASLART